MRQNTHQQVKSKILERMEEWTKMFSSNTELGIMEQAYMKLKAQSTLTGHVLFIDKTLTRPRSQPATSAGSRKETNHRLRQTERGGRAANGPAIIHSR